MSVGIVEPGSDLQLLFHRGCWIVEHNSTVGMNSPQNSNVVPIMAPDENNDGGARRRRVSTVCHPTLSSSYPTFEREKDVQFP